MVWEFKNLIDTILREINVGQNQNLKKLLFFTISDSELCFLENLGLKKLLKFTKKLKFRTSKSAKNDIF